MLAFTAGEQNGEDVEHDDTARIDHNLYRTEERISQQEVDACRAEKHEQQVCGRTYHAFGRYRQYGEYADEGRKEVKYYCFKINSMLLITIMNDELLRCSQLGSGGFLLLFYVTARMVQRQYQFRAVEYGMLEVLVERDGIVRAGIDAELAEHARTEVVFVLRQYLLFLAVFRFNHLAVTLMVSLGQAVWHKPQATHRCSFFSLWGMVSVPRKRSESFNVERFSGYCSVVFRRQNTVMVVFIPVSREVTPCMSPPI